jgi:hypothetical protein
MQQYASRLRSIDAAAKRSKPRTGMGHDLQARPRLERGGVRSSLTGRSWRLWRRARLGTQHALQLHHDGC